MRKRLQHGRAHGDSVQRPHWFVSHAWIEPWLGKPSRLFEIVLLHCLSATSYFFR